MAEHSQGRMRSVELMAIYGARKLVPCTGPVLQQQKMASKPNNHKSLGS